MATEKRWTVCTRFTGGRLKKWCQYKTKERAEAHAASIKGFVMLAPINPQRKVKLGGRRSCECFISAGLPQYD